MSVIRHISDMEVTDINKQKFLAELGRLLSFMYEEDRKMALDLYSRMFDDAEDLQGLLQHLISPTRQAVVVARAYDAREHKLEVHSQYRDEDDGPESGELPAFILAIDDVYQKAVEQGLMSELPQSAAVLDDQFSLFADDAHPFADEIGLFDAQPVPAEEPAAPMAEDEPSFHEETQDADAAEESEETYHPEPQDAVDAFLANFSIAAKDLIAPEKEAAVPAEEDAPQEEAPAEQETESSPESSAPEQELAADNAEETPEACAPEEAEAVAEPEETAEEPAAEEVEAEAAAEETAPAEGMESLSVAEESAPTAEEPLPEEETAVTEAAPARIRKARVPLLILYILLAIPVGLLGLGLLLIPTILVLALASSMVMAASASFVAAFSGFAVFADFMVVLGIALALAAIGLLLLWLFIWFIGGAMVGLVKGIVRLGAKCCYKEVAAE